jgi:flagellar motor switch protein FliM
MQELTPEPGDVKKPFTEARKFDFRNFDKLAKSQLQALHLVHENFARNVASSLSAYLRSYVAVILVSLEQISYGDFLGGISSPGCIAYISLEPYDGSAVLDINTALAFRFIELLLGSKEQAMIQLHRKMTDIEKKLLQTVLRILLHDLRDSWKSVADIDFAVQSLANEPQLLHVLAPSETMIVITIDVRLGALSGLINLAIPSIFVKRLRNNFDQLRKVAKTEAADTDQLHVTKLLQNLKLNFDIQLPGGDLHGKTLFDLKVGDVLVLDHPRGAPVRGLLNGKQKWLGNVLEHDGKLAFEVSGNVS